MTHLRKTRAGEGIRTLDPNLGIVEVRGSIPPGSTNQRRSRHRLGLFIFRSVARDILFTRLERISRSSCWPPHELSRAEISRAGSAADSGARCQDRLERIRFRNTATGTCTIGFCARTGCFNCTRGTRKTTPISSTRTPRRRDTTSCCDSKWTISTRRWRALAGWGLRSSKSLTSTLHPSTGR